MTEVVYNSNYYDEVRESASRGKRNAWACLYIDDTRASTGHGMSWVDDLAKKSIRCPTQRAGCTAVCGVGRRAFQRSRDDARPVLIHLLCYCIALDQIGEVCVYVLHMYVTSYRSSTGAVCGAIGGIFSLWRLRLLFTDELCSGRPDIHY